MSRNRKNNHYHFAEQYTDGNYRRRARASAALRLPKRAVFFAVLVLIALGVITTTFSANVTTDDESSGGALVVRVRNARTAQSYIADGMDKEEAYAMVGADMDLAQTAATTYYYRGDGNSWGATAFTDVSGYYAYYDLGSLSTSGKEFKVTTGNNNWTVPSNNLNWSAYSYTDCESNSISLSDVTLTTGSAAPGTNNGKLKPSSNQTQAYLLLFYTSSTFNSDTSQIQLAVSTTLPTINTSVYNLWGVVNTASDTDSGWGFLKNDIANNSYSVSLTAGYHCQMKVYKDKMVTYKTSYGFISHDAYYGNNTAVTASSSSASVTRTLSTSGNNVKVTAGTITGTHTFAFNSSSKVLTVTYPTYSMGVSESHPSGGVSATFAPTVGGSTSAQTTYQGSYKQYKANTPTGYDFEGWRVTAGSAKFSSSGTVYSANATTIRNTSATVNVYPAGTSSTVTLQAVYKIAEFIISYAKGSATGVDGTVDSTTKLYNQAGTLSSSTFTRNGYTQVGWAASENSTTATYSLGGSYPAANNSNATLYPVWQLNTPTKSDNLNSAPQIASTGSMTVRSTPVSLGLDVSGGQTAVGYSNNDITRSYSASITGPAGSTRSVGCDPSDSDTFMKFTADTPGTYTVTITVTDVSATNVTNTNNTASATTNTCSITVMPDSPVFDITFYGNYNDPNRPDRDGTTTQKAYMILLGNRYYFSAELDSTYLSNHPLASGYTYQWSTDASFGSQYIVGTGTSITFIDDGTPNYQLITYDPTHTYDPENNDPDPRMLAEESDGSMHSVSLYCRVTRNSVSNDSSLKQRWYFIQPLIKSFEYEPFQKIFNMNDQTVSLAAQYNVQNNPAYTTKLYFSSNNSNNQSDWTLAETEAGFISSFANAIRSYLYPSGPKYFYLLMNGYNSQGEEIESRSEKIHTTVHTSDSTASRALYFNNSVANTSLKNYLVMCYYIDGSGNLCYQTAQDLYTYDDDPEDETTYDNNGLHYRVMIPADAQSVCFGFLSCDIEGVYYYGTPVLSGGAIGGFTGPFYYGYTDQITLTDSVRVITANSASTDANSLHSFSCTAGAY